MKSEAAHSIESFDKTEDVTETESKRENYSASIGNPFYTHLFNFLRF